MDRSTHDVGVDPAACPACPGETPRKAPAVPQAAFPHPGGTEATPDPAPGVQRASGAAAGFAVPQNVPTVELAAFAVACERYRLAVERVERAAPRVADARLELALARRDLHHADEQWSRATMGLAVALAPGLHAPSTAAGEAS